MKILTFVDLHGSLPALKELVEKVHKGKISALVCSGDLTFFGAELHELVKKFQNLGLPLIIIPGNHETSLEIQNAAKKFNFVKNVHGKMHTADSCMFFGCGGSQITPFSTPFELDERELEAKLKKFRKKKSNKFMLVVHEPPYNTRLDYLDGVHIGSKAIRKFIELYQPDYCICGHFHENAGKEDEIGSTKIINPGPSGKIIEL